MVQPILHSTNGNGNVNGHADNDFLGEIHNLPHGMVVKVPRANPSLEDSRAEIHIRYTDENARIAILSRFWLLGGGMALIGLLLLIALLRF